MAVQRARLQEFPAGIPQFVDWRMKNVVTPVRQQGKCNCCWAIVATGAIESSYALKNQVTPVQLSVQELVNCVKEYPEKEEQDERGCYTSTVNRAFRWIMKHGVLFEIDCPFTGWKEICAPKSESSQVLRIKDYGRIDDGDEAKLLTRIAHRPVAAVIKITKEFIQLTGEEIYEGPADGDYRLMHDGKLKVFQHALLITRYGTTRDGKNYYEVRNSWGTNWGNNGYARVLRDSSLPVGRESLLRRASYPILL